MAKCDFCESEFSFKDGEGKQVIIEKTNSVKYKHEQLVMLRCNKCSDNKINVCSLGSKIHNDENPKLSYIKHSHDNQVVSQV